MKSRVISDLNMTESLMAVLIVQRLLNLCKIAQHSCHRLDAQRGCRCRSDVELQCVEMIATDGL